MSNNEKYIQYWKYDTDINGNKVDGFQTITFSDLEKYKDCIDWMYISNHITEKTCTPDFYNTFNDNLIWNSSDFVKYVREEDLYNHNRMNTIAQHHLFRIKPNLSEQFCRDYIAYRCGNNSSYRYVYSYIFEWNTQISTNFIEDAFIWITKQSSNWCKCGVAKAIAFNQRITEEQYEKYIVPERNLLTKFEKFVVLSNPKNNYSVEFIKKYKADMNQMAFFRTQQASDYLAQHIISDNALSIFKTKIDYVEILNRACREDVLNTIASKCKKELFDIIIKYSDKLTSKINQKNLDYLKGLM